MEYMSAPGPGALEVELAENVHSCNGGCCDYYNLDIGGARAALDAAHNLVKLLMQKPKPSLKTIATYLSKLYMVLNSLFH
jgi:hypothetical protein